MFMFVYDAWITRACPCSPRGWQEIAGQPEIDATEVHRWHADSRVQAMPERYDVICHGGEAEIWSTAPSTEVIRQLKHEWWDAHTGGTHREQIR